MCGEGCGRVIRAGSGEQYDRRCITRMTMCERIPDLAQGIFYRSGLKREAVFV
jgi:hypothetical protein